MGAQRVEEPRHVRPPAEQQVQTDNHREGDEGLLDVGLGDGTGLQVERAGGIGVERGLEVSECHRRSFLM